MAALTLQKTWVIELTTGELLLVLKALGDRLNDDEEDEAAALGKRVTELRAKLLRQAERDGERLEAAVGGITSTG